MSFKSKFLKDAYDLHNRSNSNYDYYLDLKKFNLEKFKFEKEQKDYLFDILPYKIETDKHPDFGKKEKAYNLEIFVHTYVGINNGNYLCMEKMYNKPCVICEEFRRLRDKYENEGLSNEEIWGKISDFAYKQRIIYHILYKGKRYLFDTAYNTKKVSSSFESSWVLVVESLKKKGEQVYPFYMGDDDCRSIEFTYIPTTGNFFELVNFSLCEIKNYDSKNVEGLVSLEKLLIIPDQNKIKDSLLGIYEEDEQTEKKKDYYEDVVVKEAEQKGLEAKIETNEPVRKKKKVKENECPYEEQFDTKFGQDYDEFQHCDKCLEEHNEVFEACKKAYNEGK